MVLGTVRAFIYSTVRSTLALQITNIPTPTQHVKHDRLSLQHLRALHR